MTESEINEANRDVVNELMRTFTEHFRSLAKGATEEELLVPFDILAAGGAFTKDVAATHRRMIESAVIFHKNNVKEAVAIKMTRTWLEGVANKSLNSMRKNKKAWNRMLEL